MCDDKVGQKEGNRRADTRPAAVSTPDNNTIRYAATGGVDSGGGLLTPSPVERDRKLCVQ